MAVTRIVGGFVLPLVRIVPDAQGIKGLGEIPESARMHWRKLRFFRLLLIPTTIIIIILIITVYMPILSDLLSSSRLLPRCARGESCSTEQVFSSASGKCLEDTAGGSSTLDSGLGAGSWRGCA